MRSESSSIIATTLFIWLVSLVNDKKAIYNPRVVAESEVGLIDIFDSYII